MEWLTHKLQLLGSSVFGALLFIGFVFLIRKRARTLKYRILYENLPNEFEDYSEEKFQQQEAILSTFANETTKYRDYLIESILENYPPNYSFKHHSIYYGSSGLSFLFWRLFNSETRKNTEKREKYLELSRQVSVLYLFSINTL